MKQLRVGGVWLNQVGGWGEMSYSSRWPVGDYEASWTMSLPRGFRHPALRRGKLVEVMNGPQVIWSGLLTEPDRAEWKFTAEGLGREAEHYFALDAAGNTTTVGNTAIDAAITRGLPWIRRASVASTATTAATDSSGINTIASVLDSAADRAGQRWTVGPDHVVQMLPDPTVPDWHVTPGAVDLGVADDEYASHVFARYKDSASGSYLTATASDATAAARWGHREHAEDLTPLGPLTTSRANDIVAGILTKGKARLGWTNGLEVSPYELTSPGGIPADLSMVRARDLVRVHGYSVETGRRYVDVVVSEAVYVDGEATVQLTPQGYNPRDWESITERAIRAGTQRKLAG